MTFQTLPRLALVLALSGLAGMSHAQTAPAAAPAANAAPASDAKKELVARLLKLQQPSIEALARRMTEEPAVQMLDRAALALPSRVAPDRQDAVAKEIQADTRKYLDDTVPLVRNRAVQLAPSTLGVLLQQKLSEDELRQVVAMLESPAYAKYLQLSGEMQQALQEKLVPDTRAAVEARLRTLEQSISTRLGIAPAPAAAKPAAPAAPAAPAKPAANKP